MQPDIRIFSMGDPDFRWVGNELGLAPLPCWNTVTDVPVAVDSKKDEAVPKPTWLPAECDCRMRLQNWFFSDQDENTVKSLDELLGIYYLSVGRGCNLLLNIGPDRRGLLPDVDTARLLEFGDEIRRRFSAPLATLTNAQHLENRWEFSFDTPILIDHAVIREDLTRGEHIQRYSLSINPNHQQRWITIWQGESLGHKAVCRFPTVSVRKFRLDIEESTGCEKLRSLDLYYTGHTS